jgi:FtsP/CotA-like multicopper oxidase with cupredoxin domain
MNRAVCGRVRVTANTSPAVDLDRTARHNTVRIESNELVEILVYDPPGFVGDNVYHCHLPEHEDMRMMAHFKVIA